MFMAIKSLSSADQTFTIKKTSTVYVPVLPAKVVPRNSPFLVINAAMSGQVSFLPSVFNYFDHPLILYIVTTETVLLIPVDLSIPPSARYSLLFLQSCFGLDDLTQHPVKLVFKEHDED